MSPDVKGDMVAIFSQCLWSQRTFAAVSLVLQVAASLSALFAGKVSKSASQQVSKSAS
jgi:hypothetical protein